MNAKLAANSALASAAIIALLGIIARRLGLPWISEALAFFKLPGVEIKWDGVWLIILITCVVFLIGVNLSAIRRWNQNRVEQNKRHWDINFCDALGYLVSDSLEGQAWPSASRVQFAAGALYQAAKMGQIALSGLPEGSVLRVKIPKHWFNGKTVVNIESCTAQYKAAFLLEDKRVLFGMLFADKKQIAKIWPPRPRSLYPV
jgi:hypothetical protein